MVVVICHLQSRRALCHKKARELEGALAKLVMLLSYSPPCRKAYLLVVMTGLRRPAGVRCWDDAPTCRSAAGARAALLAVGIVLQSGGRRAAAGWRYLAAFYRQRAAHARAFLIRPTHAAVFRLKRVTSQIWHGWPRPRGPFLRRALSLSQRRAGSLFGSGGLPPRKGRTIAGGGR